MRLVTMKFSASQTTARVVDQLCAGLRLPRKDLNLNEGVSLGPQDCLIAAFPVFSGKAAGVLPSLDESDSGTKHACGCGRRLRQPSV